MYSKNKDYFICDELTVVSFIWFCSKKIFNHSLTISIMNHNYFSTLVSKIITVKVLSLRFDHVNKKLKIDDDALALYKISYSKISSEVIDPFVKKFNNYYDKNFLHRFISKYILQEIYALTSFELLLSQHNSSKENSYYSHRLVQIKNLLNSKYNLRYDLLRFFFSKVMILGLFFIYITKPLFLKIKNSNNPTIALRYYISGFNLQSNPKIDWMIDRKFLKEEDTAVIAEYSLSKITRNSLKKKYSIINAHKIFYDFNGSLKSFLLTTPRNFRYIFLHLLHASKPFGAYYSIELIMVINFLRWQSVLNNSSLSKYISYHDYGIDSLIRNFFMEKRDIKTIHYKHTFTDNIWDLNNSGFRVHQSHIKYDLEMHWGLSSLNQSIASLSESRLKKIIGPLWTDTVTRNIRDDLLTISVFPSSYSENSVHNDRDHLEFLRSVQILSSKPWVKKIIFKGKSPFKNYLSSDLEELSDLAKSLLANQKFHELPFSYSVQMALNKSNLSISMSFTSSFLVSLFSGVRSIYFDPFKRYKNSMYYLYDSFISYNYETLEVAIKNLHSLNDIEFQALQKHICVKEFGGHDLNKSSTDRFISILKRG